MNKIMNKIFVVFIIFILIFVYSNPIFAEENLETNNVENTEENENQENDEMNNLESQKSNLENAISENESQIGVVQGQLSQILEEVETLELKIAQKKQEISSLESEEISLMDYIEDAEIELKKSTEKYEKEKKLLEERLVVMYEIGETKYLDLLLNSTSLSDFLSRYYLISEVTKADYELVQSVKKSKTQAEVIATTLKEKKEELEKDKTDKEKYQISLSNMEILKNNKIGSLNEQELALHAQIEAYRNEIQGVEYEIKQLALQNLGEKYIGGTMIWPTPGYTTITSPFGMRTHPITGIYKLHTGMDIGAPYGANFVAANDGVVIKAGPNSAYGNMVMIDHGGGIVTLYAHGSGILVSVGDIVSQGQPVLKVGSTGYSTGPHAHFEIRLNGEYINPADYVTPENNTSQEFEEEVVDLTR